MGTDLSVNSDDRNVDAVFASASIDPVVESNMSGKGLVIAITEIHGDCWSKQ